LDQKNKFNTRAIAAVALDKIVNQGLSLNHAVVQNNSKLDARDYAFLQELVYGCCRYYWQLDWIVEQLVKKPLKSKDSLIKHLLYVGLYQLIYCRMPDYAILDQTVGAAKVIKKTWAGHLINAVLRQYRRQQDSIQEGLKVEIEAHYSHPKWLVKRLYEAWSDDYQKIMAANNQHPPLVIRVNRQKNTVTGYIDKCKQIDLEVEAHPYASFALEIKSPVKVEKLPGFFQGECSVQDAASQLIEPLLNVQPGNRVLDACAAPGGKTGLLLEATTDIKLLAIDNAADRMAKLTDNLKRLQLSAEIKIADCALLDSWWDGQLFDRILIDAPCSATGVIRRHPDIKLLRRDTDIQKLVIHQLELLTVLWGLLKPGGRLLYTTCSVLPDENENIISEFLASHNEAADIDLNYPWAKKCKHGIQLLPGDYNMDGFYYAAIEHKQ